jgi:hypothetical protein
MAVWFRLGKSLVLRGGHYLALGLAVGLFGLHLRAARFTC